MKTGMGGMVLGFLLMAVNVYAANGDLIVNGNLGLSTSTPQGKVDVRVDGRDYLLEGTVSGALSPRCACDTTDWEENCPETIPTTDALGTTCYDWWGWIDTQDQVSNKYTVEPRVAIYISPAGNLGVRTKNPDVALDVIGDVRASGNLQIGKGPNYFGGEGYFQGSVQAIRSSGYNNYAIRGSASGTGALYGVVAYGPSNGYDFYAQGPGINYGADSSIRWKKNIKEVDNALNMVAGLRGVYFDWDKEHGGKHDIGFIGEEVGKYVPEIVVWDEKDNQYVTGMDYSKMTPVLLQAIKEQQKQIEALKTEVEALKKILSKK